MARSWQHLLAAKRPTCPFTPSWTHFSLSDDFGARFVPKKAQLQEELKTKKVFFSLPCLPAAWPSACALPSSLARNHGVDDTSLLLCGALSLSEPFHRLHLVCHSQKPREGQERVEVAPLPSPSSPLDDSKTNKVPGMVSQGCNPST